MFREGFFDHTESGMAIKATANASGIAQGYLGPVQPGYCWYVERETTWTSGSAGECEVFVLTTNQMPSGMSATAGDRSGRQDVSLSANDDVSDNESPIYVDEGYYLVAFWTGLASGDLAILSTQISIHRKSLVIESPEQVIQQVDPTPNLAPPDTNVDEVREDDEVLDNLVQTTAAAFSSSDKAL